MADFTKGPWIAIRGVEEDDEYRCGVAAVRGDCEYLIATVENGAPGDSCDTEFSNAHLIAAAPELFEALEFKAVYEAMPQDRGGKNGANGRAKQAYDGAASAALAKAKGEGE